MLPNCPQAVISYYGALMAGGIVVQTNPLYTERELEYQMIDSGAKYIVCLVILVHRIMNISNNTSIEHVIVNVFKNYLPFHIIIFFSFLPNNILNMFIIVI